MNRRTFLATAPTLALLGQGANALAQATAEPSGKIAAILEEIKKEYPQMLSVAPAEGKFLSMQTRLSSAKEVLEIGTSRGYSALWIASALKQTGGRLATIDILKERSEEAREYAEKAGVANLITFHIGDAHKLVPNLNKKFDLVLLDADKKGNLDYFQKLHPALLAPNALLIAHGAQTMEKDMKPFIDAVAAHKDYDSLTVNIVTEEAFFVALRK